jgi:DnaJ-class molecular chaperone
METFVLFAGMALLAFIHFRSLNRGGTLRCNRCDGTGQVNERWPDPKEATGWHIVEGICPKCKGKGKI